MGPIQWGQNNFGGAINCRFTLCKKTVCNKASQTPCKRERFNETRLGTMIASVLGSRCGEVRYIFYAIAVLVGSLGCLLSSISCSVTKVRIHEANIRHELDVWIDSDDGQFPFHFPFLKQNRAETHCNNCAGSLPKSVFYP
jgi:hypothetical protein